MSSSTISDDSYPKCKDVSVQEFRRSESFCNILPNPDLLIISNRNLHLQAIIKEFSEFSMFITQRNHFLPFLTPVFQNLCLLLMKSKKESEKGRSDAKNFLKCFKYLPISKEDQLALIERTSDQDGNEYQANNFPPRIKVKLPSTAYHDLMEWLKKRFTESMEMFTILRVLHENFLLDIYNDKDEEEFAAIEYEVLQSNQEFLSQVKVIPEKCDTSKSEGDVIQKMSKLNIDDETPKTPESPESVENQEDDIEIQENGKHLDPETSDVTTKYVMKEEQQAQMKYKPFAFQDSYKTNFHSVYPITISGKDVLCASDISPDLRYVACSFLSFKICTWRLSETDFQLQPIGTLRGHKGIVYALSIDSNRKTLISGSHDCSVIVWDIEESKCLRKIEMHSGPVYDVCISPNSKYFLSASEDKKIVLSWYDDVHPVQVYVGHSQDAINCVRFHPNCGYFASASSDVFLFKINNEKLPVRMFSKHKAIVYTISFSPCGKLLASADVEGVLIIWDILTYSPIKRIKAGQEIRSISYDNSGSFITALFYYHSWKVYNVEEESENVVIAAESVAVPKSVHFSIDNKMFIIQFAEMDKNKIAEMEERPKTTITMVN